MSGESPAFATVDSQSRSLDDYFNSFPLGYRFRPTDEEIVSEYLVKKVQKLPLPLSRIVEVNLYRFNPHDLAAKYKKCGENEWYFLTPRDRKYKNGQRPNRRAGDGFWKATGSDKEVISNRAVIGVKRVLVFYKGNPGDKISCEKTNWIMHEYTLPKSHLSNTKIGTTDMQLDEWVLCKIYENKSTKLKACETDHVDVQSPPIELNIQQEEADFSGRVFPSPETFPGYHKIFSAQVPRFDYNPNINPNVKTTGANRCPNYVADQKAVPCCFMPSPIVAPPPNDHSSIYIDPNLDQSDPFHELCDITLGYPWDFDLVDSFINPEPIDDMVLPVSSR